MIIIILYHKFLHSVMEHLLFNFIFQPLTYRQKEKSIDSIYDFSSRRLGSARVAKLGP